MSGFINWGHESDSQREMRRRFDEMIFEQARIRAISNAQGGAGGGSLKSGIRSVQTAFVSYVNNETDTWEFFCASPVDGAFSEPFNTQIPDTFSHNALDDVYPLNLGGYAAVFRLNNQRDIYFVSAAGKVLNRLEIPNSSNLDINVDHNVNQVLIVDHDSQILWTWDGTTLYENTTVLRSVDYSIGTNGDSFNNFIANGSLIVRTTTEPIDGQQTDTWYFVKNGVATPFDTLQWGSGDYRRQFAAFSRSNNLVSWAYEVDTNYITGYGIVNETGDYIVSGPVDLVGATNINWEWYGELNNIWISVNNNDTSWIFNWDTVAAATDMTIPRVLNTQFTTSTNRISASSEWDPIPSNSFVATHGEWTATYYPGGLGSVNDFTLIYKFPGQEAKSFTITGESYFNQYPYFIGDNIFVGVFDQSNFRFLKITPTTPSLEEVTTVADLRSYFVQDLMFDVESNVTYLELERSSAGIVFSSYSPSENISQIQHYNGDNWEVDGSLLSIEDWDASTNTQFWTEAGAYLRFAGGDLVAWLPALNQWQTVLENVDEGMDVLSTRTRFNPDGRDGARFVVTSGDGTGLNDKIVTSSQIIPITGIPTTYSTLRVGEAGICVDYEDGNRDNLRSYKFFDFEGNLKWTFDTQYNGRNGFAFTDTRAISDLYDHQTEAGQVAIFIGNASGAKLKEITNSTNIDYSINDVKWYD